MEKFSGKPKSSSSRYLIILTGAIFLMAICSFMAISIFPVDIEGGDTPHWMVPVGMAVMVSFMPLMAVSFLQFRLPQKQKEFDSILAALNLEKQQSEKSSFVVNTEFKDSDYLLPVVFVAVFSVLGYRV